MKKIYFAALFGFAAFSAVAEYVTPEQALARLNEGNSGPMHVRAASGAKLMREFPELYVFSTASGYMILPSDDVARPVLGYGDEFVTEGNPAFEYWLNFYAEEIKAAKQNPAAYSSVATFPRKVRKAVAPLVKAKWNQDSPYNELCPLYNGTRSVTGCVATAMAQVMHYHQWPEKGVGTHSYKWEAGGKTLSFDYGATTFDWANMLDSYSNASSSTERTAVATLMYAAGVSVNMNYTPQASGAVSQNMLRAFIENFNYDKAVWYAVRNCYTSADWEDLIYGEVAEGRPVLYGGQSVSGGHQFVVDGYSSDGYFHLNWGWGGQSDGYFTLSALNPHSLGIGGGAGGYNFSQDALIGLQKPVAGSEVSTAMYNVKPFLPAAQSGKVGETISFTGMFVNYGYTTNTYTLGVKFTPLDESNETLYIPWPYSPSTLQSGYGWTSVAVTIPAMAITDGAYDVTPIYSVGNSGVWTDMPCDLSVNHSVRAEVSGTEIQFSTPDAPSISATNLKLLTPLYWGMPCEIKFSLTNNNDNEFNGSYVPVLFSTSGTSVATGNKNPVILGAGETTDVDLNFTFSAASAPAAGSYLLAIANAETGAVISSAIPVELKSAPTQTSVDVSNLVMERDINDLSAVKFNMNVTCEKGYYAGQVQVVIFDTKSLKSILWGYTPVLYIEEGKSIPATAVLNLSDLALGGTYYLAAVVNGQQFAHTPITLPSEVNGIDEVASDVASEARELYDLQGRRVVNPTRRGIYLTPDGKKILL